jgi:hypothetical protein
MVRGPPTVSGGSPGGLQVVSEEKLLQKLQTLNKKYPHMYVLKLPSFVDLRQEVGELFLSITSCPSIVI